MRTTTTTTQASQAPSLMAAKWGGICRLCGERFQAGELIAWSKATGPAHAGPGGCGPATLAALQASPLVQAQEAQADLEDPRVTEQHARLEAERTLGAHQVMPTIPPAFQAPAGDSESLLGRAGLLFLLTHGDTASWRLDDGALAATAEYCSVAVTAKGISVQAVDQVAELQRRLRGLVAGRRADALRILEALQAISAPEGGQEPTDGGIVAPEAPQAPGGGKPGGGSKVPRKPRPTKGGPSAALPLPRVSPDETGQQGSWGVPALALADDAF